MLHMKDYVEFVGLLALFFGNQALKYIKKKRIIDQAPAKLDAEYKIRLEISEYIKKIQAYTGASRVAMFEYSNGTKTHSNTCLQFVECSYESTDEVTRPIIQDFKRMPIGPFLKILDNIANSKTKWYKVTDEDEDEDIAKLQKYYRVSTSYNFKITDVVYDGVVSASWINKKEDLTQEEISNIEIIIMRIYNLMSKLSNNK